jgi:large subunit ribosomal protein L24
MAKAKIQTGDSVKVIAGNYRGTVGQVLAIVKKTTGKVTKIRASVAGIPGLTKFRRSFKYNGQSYPGSMYSVPRLIDVSNLSHQTADGKVSKVAIKTNEAGKKVRLLKKTGQEIVAVRVEKTKPLPSTEEQA